MPIIGQWDAEDQFNRVPPLSTLLNASKEDMPHIYLLHSLTEQVVMYPERLDDVNNFSPDLIMAWAQMTVISIEINNYERQLAEPESAADGNDQQAEEPLSKEMREEI